MGAMDSPVSNVSENSSYEVSMWSDIIQVRYNAFYTNMFNIT